MQNNIDESLTVGSGTTVTGYNNCLPSLPGVGDGTTIVTTNNLDFVGFADSAAGNYRLTPESPCVNAGNDQLQ